MIASLVDDIYDPRQYRRECLKFLSADLASELNFMDTFTEDNPKNYQIWYHRRAVVESYGNGEREREFCNKVFLVDSKNYHAWAHRYGLMTQFCYVICLFHLFF